MIKFLDLKKINAPYGGKIKTAVADVIDSGIYLGGAQREEFARELKDYLGAEHVIPLGSGLDALQLILKAYIIKGKLKPGDEVIVPANTYIASVLAITANRLKPVFVEPNAETLNLDFEKAEDAITSRTKAIMTVHLYGRAAWSEKIEELARKHSLLVIEDNAQAIGAGWNGFYTGTLGDAAGFSFYPTKNLGAMGNSGAAVVKDGELAEIIQALGNYGSTSKGIAAYTGTNSRMDEIQAAVLRIKLRELDRINNARREIAKLYIENINNPLLTLPGCPAKAEEHVWHLFTARTKERNRLRKHMYDRGIETAVHYPVPPHKQACYQQWNGLSLPVTENIHDEIVSIPLNESLTDGEIDTIITALNSFGI